MKILESILLNISNIRRLRIFIICWAPTILGAEMTKAPENSFTIEILKTLGALMVVIGLFLVGIYAYKWLLKRFPNDTTKRVYVHERVILVPRHYLYLIECDGELFLIACSPAGISLLCRLKDQNLSPENVKFNDFVSMQWLGRSNSAGLAT